MIQHYNSVDQKLHQLSQIIAKFNRTFVPKKEDDSHTNLQYDCIGNRILGRWFDTEKGKVIIGFHLDSLTFLVYDSQWKVIFENKAIGKNQVEIEHSFKPFCDQYHLNFEAFQQILHFDITAYSFLNEKYEPLHHKGIEDWKKWRKIAFNVCGELLENLQLKSEIRIWPHHFDTGIYTEVNENIGIGFGLAMKDTVCNAPYFYFSAYGLNGYSINYDLLTPLQVGRWKNLPNWKGAVLEIETASENDIYRFINEVRPIYLNV
ncbi:hypothetical protein [Flammeovirga aprica]|uniref:Uncharacterized protein n=1 Tax=Flammeovirga aprica JL-4 TaxID=694437 RepID=A0A7X9P208_9BACT|nr:hypothetical protein [Flammeovirga aprica]NME68093.1 hypothetical protein [Flammeovirga aprica JL-4]